MMINFLILMALIGEIGFMLMSVLAKRLRNKGITGRSIVAAHAVTLPLWIGVFVYLSSQQSLNLPWQYLACVAVWLGICYALNFGSPFVSRFQSLGEGVGYRFGFAVLIALGLDVFVFGTQFPSSLILTVGLLVAGGVLFHAQRAKQDFSSSRLVPLHMKLGAVFVLALAEVGAYGLFKYGASLQDGVLMHNAVFQALLFALFLVAGGRVLLRDCRDGTFPLPYLLALVVLVFVAVTAESFAVAGLPLVLFILFSLLRTTVFTLNDLKEREAALNPISAIGVALIAAGFISMAFLTGL